MTLISGAANPYYRKGDYRQAISDYRTYLNNTRQRNTDMYALAHYNLGYCYFKLKRIRRGTKPFPPVSTWKTTGCTGTGRCFTTVSATACTRIASSHRLKKTIHVPPNCNRLPATIPFTRKASCWACRKDYRGKISAMDRLISEYPESQYVDDALFEKRTLLCLARKQLTSCTGFRDIDTAIPAKQPGP